MRERMWQVALVESARPAPPVSHRSGRRRRAGTHGNLGAANTHLVDSIRSLLIPQPDGAELGVHHAGRDRRHAHRRAHEVVARGRCERVDCELSRTVDGAPGVRLVACDVAAAVREWAEGWRGGR
eukprot:2439460-Prymnesium_polylepis.1